MRNEPGEGGRKKDSVRAMAKASGLSLSQMNLAKEAGVDTKDLDALKAFRATINTRSDSRNSPPRQPSETDGTKMSVEDIEEALSMKGLTPNDARVLKIQLDGLKAAVALKQQKNELISREEVRDSDARIAHAVAAMVRKLENEIPALCFGQHDLGKLKQTVKDFTRQIQQAVADGQEEFWKSHPES